MNLFKRKKEIFIKSDMIKYSEIYEMRLHESLKIEKFTIVRVPGGWLYSSEDGGGVAYVPLKFETGLLEDQLKKRS